MTETKKVIYTAKARTTGGREGRSRTDDDRLQVELSDPARSPTGTNPEQLFAAGWSACYLSALQLLASKRKIAFAGEPSNDIEVDLLTSSDGFSLRVRHTLTLPGVDRETARSLAEAAHQICPYSKATRGNIEVETHVL
jgi:osmotically inducible protein OsmC